MRCGVEICCDFVVERNASVVLCCCRMLVGVYVDRQESMDGAVVVLQRCGGRLQSRVKPICVFSGIRGEGGCTCVLCF